MVHDKREPEISPLPSRVWPDEQLLGPPVIGRSLAYSWACRSWARSLVSCRTPSWLARANIDI